MSRVSDGLTGELFSGIPKPMPETPESMDFRAHVGELINEMVAKAKANHGLDRWDIAARMSRLAGVETSKALLDSYTARSREECNLPFWKAPLLDLACREKDLVEWHARVLGGRVLWGSDILDADVGQRKRQIAQLQAELKAIETVQRHQRRAR